MKFTKVTKFMAVITIMLFVSANNVFALALKHQDPKQAPSAELLGLDEAFANLSAEDDAGKRLQGLQALSDASLSAQEDYTKRVIFTRLVDALSTERNAQMVSGLVETVNGLIPRFVVADLDATVKGKFNSIATDRPEIGLNALAYCDLVLTEAARADVAAQGGSWQIPVFVDGPKNVVFDTSRIPAETGLQQVAAQTENVMKQVLAAGELTLKQGNYTANVSSDRALFALGRNAEGQVYDTNAALLTKRLPATAAYVHLTELILRKGLGIPQNTGMADGPAWQTILQFRAQLLDAFKAAGQYDELKKEWKWMEQNNVLVRSIPQGEGLADLPINYFEFLDAYGNTADAGQKKDLLQNFSQRLAQAA